MAKAIEASDNANSGWKIYPEIFALSDVRGSLSPSRTYDTKNATWYQGAVVKKRVIDDHSIEFSCPIPPNATTATRRIEEVYLYGRDWEGNDFLLSVGQPSSDLVYYPDGSITLRLVITITNLNISEMFTFSYVDSIDVDEHNEDPAAHNQIVTALADWITGLGKAVLKNGQIVRGGAILLDKQETGAYIAKLEAAFGEATCPLTL